MEDFIKPATYLIVKKVETIKELKRNWDCQTDINLPYLPFWHRLCSEHPGSRSTLFWIHVI